MASEGTHTHTLELKTSTTAISNLGFCSPTQAELSVFGHFIHHNVNEVEWVILTTALL